MDHTVAALSNNRGATLIIGLLTLVLLTLIGIAATSTSRMEVQIAGNDKMFKEAFYASEFGLTNGENTLEALLSRVDLDEGSVPGHYGQDTQPAWHDLLWNSTDSVQVPAGDMPDDMRVAARPRYTIEERRFTRDSLTTGIGAPTGIYQFNVSARGVGSNPTSEVVLETVYARRFN
jgi:type IV pilus assembly protein PilX